MLILRRSMEGKGYNPSWLIKIALKSRNNMGRGEEMDRTFFLCLLFILLARDYNFKSYSHVTLKIKWSSLVDVGLFINRLNQKPAENNATKLLDLAAFLRR